MRVFFLVLLLILNVFAEAKSSGSVHNGKSSKKAKTVAVSSKKPAKATKKTSKKATSKPVSSSSSDSYTTSSDSTDSSSESSVASDSIDNTATISTTSVADLQDDELIVRDTIVDTVYVVMPEASKPEQEPQGYNIPLPRQSAYLREGISVGIGAGLFNASKDCDCLGVWQGQLEYHYKDYITGGFDVRFFGGTLDRDVMLMYQRYRLNAKFHKSFTGADFYAGVMLGLETTDLSEFRKELREGVHGDRSDEVDSSAVGESSGDPSGTSESSFDKEKNCEKMFSLDGFTLGVEVGMGVVLSRYLGLVGGATYEFNFSWAQLVAVSPGIAFNLREVWPWAGRNLRSTWVSFEMVFQRYFNRGVKEWAVAGFVGVQLGI